MERERTRVLVSACLLGVRCRYDGGHAEAESFAAALVELDLAPEEVEWVPACPEQLGGLTTPRPPARIVGGSGQDVLAGRARVLRLADGFDVTPAFLRGAAETGELCERLGARSALLKSRSPSCGVGSHEGEGGSGGVDGVTAALLEARGLRIVEVDAPARGGEAS